MNRSYILFLEDVGDNALNHMPQYNEATDGRIDESLANFKTDYLDAYRRQMDAQYVDDKAR